MITDIANVKTLAFLFMKQEFDEGKKQVNNYLKYSGVGFQIAGIIGVGVLIGYLLDKYLHTPGPYFTAGISIIFIFLALFVGLKDFWRKPEE